MLLRLSMVISRVSLIISLPSMLLLLLRTLLWPCRPICVLAFITRLKLCLNLFLMILIVMRLLSLVLSILLLFLLLLFRLLPSLFDFSDTPLSFLKGVLASVARQFAQCLYLM
ncbi:MAG: hypothetical protein [Microviridae sp.]|nr:MAG: hypothetical protein [Microviridae sp.]